MTGINNYQPSFRGAMHAEDLQETTTIDPSPLIGTDDSTSQKSAAAADTATTSPQSPTYPTWRHPFKSTITFFTTLSGYFGWQFLSWLAIDQLFISGGVFALVMALVSLITLACGLVALFPVILLFSSMYILMGHYHTKSNQNKGFATVQGTGDRSIEATAIYESHCK